MWTYWIVTLVFLGGLRGLVAEVIWEAPAQELFAGNAAVGSDGTFYVFGGGGIQAIDPETQSAIWTKKFSGRVAAGWEPMRVFESESLLVVSLSSDHLGIDVASGDTRWTVQGWASRTAFLLREGLLYQGRRRSISVLDPTTGKAVDSIPLEEEVTFMVLGTDGMLYVVVNEESLVKINPDTKETLWSLDRERRDLRDLALGDHDTVYLASLSGVLAVDSLSGEMRWEADIEEGVTNVVIGGDHVIYASGANSVTALDHESGDIRWQRQGDSSPAVVSDHGLLYVWLDGWTALELGSGEEVWHHSDREAFFKTGPLLGPSGRLYLWDRSGLIVRQTEGSVANSVWPARFGNSANTGMSLAIMERIRVPTLQWDTSQSDAIQLRAAAESNLRYWLESSQDLSVWETLTELEISNNELRHRPTPQLSRSTYFRVRVE